MIQHHIKEASRDITSLGSFSFSALLFLGLAMIQQYDLLLRFIAGFGITFLATLIIRLLYYKNRPMQQRYHNRFEKVDASSFPSLHTARVTVYALLLQQIVPVYFLGLVLLLVCGSRIVLRKHDWVDIFGGFLLGLLSYWAIQVLLPILG